MSPTGVVHFKPASINKFFFVALYIWFSITSSASLDDLLNLQMLDLV